MTNYAWMKYDLNTAIRQQEINFLAVIAGRCPPLKEDGILGPGTCGVADSYSGISPKIAEMKKSCQRSNSVRSFPCFALPWNAKSKETQTMQAALNKKLVPEGFCKIKEDGILGPTTCAAAKQVLGDNAAKVGCKLTGKLSVCAAAANTSQPIAPATVPDPAPLPPVTAPEPEPVVEPDTPKKVDVTPKVGPAPPVVQAPEQPQEMSGTKWAILGAGVVAVGAGTYFLLRKKR